MTLFTNLRLLREMNLDIQLQAFQMPMLGLKPKVLIQRFHLRCFCLKTTSRTWLTKYSQTYLLFLPFFYFIEICIQKSVFLPQMYSSMSVLQSEHLCFQREDQEATSPCPGTLSFSGQNSLLSSPDYAENQA